MKKLFYLSISFFLLFVGTNSIKADWIEPAQYQQMLGSGIDVDWWTDGDTYVAQDWDNTISDFGQAGIQHVRITISKDYMSPDDFMLLDRQVGLCIQNGITPIIAYQPACSGRFSAGRRARVAQWWQVMAEHYRGYPARLSFDILPEPNSMMFATYNDLNRFYEDCVTAIRVSNPYRIVFIAPACNSDPMYLQYLRIPSRANGYLMAEWHFLSRNNYRSFWKRWNSRRAYEERWLNARIETALAWQRRTGIYTWVGGWAPGIYAETSYTAAPESLTRFLCAALLRASLPYAVRDMNRFYNYRTRSWHETAHRPMRHFFPRGNFAHSGAPVAPPPSHNGFSIGGKRFADGPGQPMRPSGRRDDYRDNRRTHAGNGFRIGRPNEERPSNDAGIRFGGNGRSGNNGRYVQMPDRKQNGGRSEFKTTGRSVRNGSPSAGSQNRPAMQSSRPLTTQPAYNRDKPAKTVNQKASGEAQKRTERKGGGGFSRGNNR